MRLFRRCFYAILFIPFLLVAGCQNKNKEKSKTEDQEILNKKYNPNNIFYDLKKIPLGKRQIIRSVHEEIQNDQNILGIDKSYLVSMTYQDIYDNSLKAVDSYRNRLEQGLKTYYDKNKIKDLIRDYESSLNSEAKARAKRAFYSQFENLKKGAISSKGLSISNAGFVDFNPFVNPSLDHLIDKLASIKLLIGLICEGGATAKRKYYYQENVTDTVYAYMNDEAEYVNPSIDKPCPALQDSEIDVQDYEISLKGRDSYNFQPQQLVLSESRLNFLKNHIDEKIEKVLGMYSDKWFIENDDKNISQIISKIDINSSDLYSMAKKRPVN